jgi:hypothetical protein
MGKSWSDAAIRRLIDWKACPRCDFGHLENGWCPSCGADMTGNEAVALAAASKAAVEALELREEALEKLPIRQRASAAAAVPVRSSTVAPPKAPLVESELAERPSSQVSVQSVLAVAGAGLVAVAAIVFTFFNPDIDDPTIRNTIVGIITLVFMGAAWMLAQVRLQFSAEAVGALGMVFVVLDVWAIATYADGEHPYGVAAAVTIVVSVLMIAIASIRRLRTWLWSGLIGIAITPLLLGISDGREWIVALGYLGVGFAALVSQEIAKRLRKRFDSDLLADRATATVIQFLVLPAVIFQLPWLEADSTFLFFVGVASFVAGLALMSALAVRNGLATAWSYIAGLLATAAVALLPFSHDFADDQWLVAIVPAVAIGAAALLAIATLIGASRENPVLNRPALMLGTLTVAGVTAVPVSFAALVQLVNAQSGSIPSSSGLVAMTGAAALALGSAVIGAVRRVGQLLVLSLWFGVLALATFATWTELSDAWRVTASLAIAVALAAIARWVRPVAAAPLRVRLPLLVGAHALILLAVIMSLADELIHIFGGIGIVAAIAVVATAMPRFARPFYVAIGYAYGLSIFAYTLWTRAELEFATVLGLTAVLAALIAIAITLVKAVPVPYWYAVLSVTAIPFVISISSMVFDRELWIGISTGVGFLLAVAIVLVHRPGITVALRALAATALVPSLAVVVINIVAVIAEKSASPITLPIVAAIVAVTLPTTGLVGAQLQRLGHAEEHAKAVQLWLEISALATGSIAVLLTIVRTASNYGTTFLVLAIIGLGAAATGLFLHRRYAWVVAFISFTGALWSLLALGNLDSTELYLMPPALAGAVIGAVAVGRGREGLGFYAVGLGIAAATPLGALAVFGNPHEPSLQLRTTGLLGGAVVLILIGWLLARIPDASRLARLRRLTVPTLFVAIGAAFGGVVQAIRHGWDWDHSAWGVGEAVLVPVLILSVGSMLLATVAALLIARQDARLAASRWLLVPAVAFLVLGPMASLRHGVAYPVTMLILTLAVLGLMIATVVVARSDRALILPPVWVTFVLAWFTAVAGWAERDLFRVEAFSIPLGLGLLAAGIIAMRPVKDAAPGLTAWPIGYERSWPLLAPGIIVTLLPSALATGTDPQTLRAILVIALALIAILIGNLRKLAAPFILGLIALPIEILIVFAVQIGDKIQATTWWITLATAGAVLLVLAVSSERGSSGDRGVAARMRDLR